MSVKTVKLEVNGQTYNLTYNDESGYWEAQATSPAKSSYNQTGHYYSMKLTATDDAGNSTMVDDKDPTFGEDLRLVVKEKVAPVVTITSPTSGASLINNKPTITWEVTDNDSGVNPDTIKITVDSGAPVMGSAITKQAIENGYTCSYVPSQALSDGSHTIKVDASDYDGNAATQKSVTFKVDTVPPTLNVTSPANNLVTNQASLTISGTTNDVTSSPVTVKIALNGQDQGDVTVGSGGNFSKTVTLKNGANTIVIKATDSAWKETSVTRTVTLDTGAPVFEEIIIEPNPVDAGATYLIKVKVTDA